MSTQLTPNDPEPAQPAEELPAAGGSYVRNPATGELTPAEPAPAANPEE